MEDEDLDISWTNELLDNHRERLDEIKLCFIYINVDNAIEKVDYQKESLTDSRITKERFLQLVQTKRHFSNKKYRLTDIQLFHVPVEYENLNAFIQEESVNFLKSIPFVNELCLEPALFIFHDITMLYIFLNEPIPPLKSVLRNEDARITKKVRLNVPDDYLTNKKKSIKEFIKRSKKTLKNLQSKPVI